MNQPLNENQYEILDYVNYIENTVKSYYPKYINYESYQFFSQYADYVKQHINLFINNTQLKSLPWNKFNVRYGLNSIQGTANELLVLTKYNEYYQSNHLSKPIRNSQILERKFVDLVNTKTLNTIQCKSTNLNNNVIRIIPPWKISTADFVALGDLILNKIIIVPSKIIRTQNTLENFILL